MKLMKPLQDEVTIWIDAPTADVWHLISDVTRIGEFSPETFEAKWARGSTGPQTGAFFTGHVRRNGIGPTYWSPCKVTVCEPEKVFEFSVGTDAATLNNWGYRLEPRDGGTQVTEYFRLEPSRAIRLYWLVFGRLRAGTNQRGMRTTLARMKAALEQERD